MRLFKYEGHRVVISPEALALKPFKKIWERDKSEDKERALQELSFIYFYCDPRSDYKIIMNDDERMEEIKRGEGLRDSWKPDKLIQEAMELYKKLTVSAAAALIEDARYTIEKIRAGLRAINFEDIEPEKVPKAIKDASSALAEVPKVIKSLMEAEKAMNSEILENSRMRGQGEKTVFEDNLGD